MEELFRYQDALLKTVNNKFRRYLLGSIEWDERMIGIKGPRGSGKTTLILQHLKYDFSDKKSALYLNVEHPWFLTHGLFYTVENFYKLGGRYVFIDEVHKYEKWSRELKVIYDGFPDMHIVFSSSSALEIYKGEADLSRRVLTYDLPGLSFREYVEFVHNVSFDKISLDDIFTSHREIAFGFAEKMQIYPLFLKYLQYGYYPGTKKVSPSLYPIYIFNTINSVLEQDLQMIDGLSPAAINKLKKLLGIIAESAPFEPNISAIASKTGTGRNTVIHFLSLLNRARIVNFLIRKQFGISALQKPDKIYLENTNLAYALKNNPNRGTLRETFLLNQTQNSGIKIIYPDKYDFLINGKYLLEVGGRNKKVRDDSVFIVKDNIEIGFGNTIPLWLFGFMY